MSRGKRYRFRLYVAGDTQNSTQAVANLAAICAEHLQGRHEIEVVNVFQHPLRALEDGILMTPTLLKLAPGPVRRVIGTLRHTLSVLQALGLEPSPA